MTRIPLPEVIVTEQPLVTDATTPGTTLTYSVISAAAYYDMYDCSAFTAFLIVHTTPTGTTPALDVRIEHSPDTENWATLDDMAQVSAAGTTTVAIPGPGTSDPKTFARYIRFSAKYANTDNVFSFTIHVSKLE